MLRAEFDVLAFIILINTISDERLCEKKAIKKFVLTKSERKPKGNQIFTNNFSRQKMRRFTTHFKV